MSRSLRSQTLESTWAIQLPIMFLPPMVAFWSAWSSDCQSNIKVTLESHTCSWTQPEPLLQVHCQTSESSETKSKTLNTSSGWKKSSAGVVSLSFPCHRSVPVPHYCLLGSGIWSVPGISSTNDGNELLSSRAHCFFLRDNPVPSSLSHLHTLRLWMLVFQTT